MSRDEIFAAAQFAHELKELYRQRLWRVMYTNGRTSMLWGTFMEAFELVQFDRVYSLVRLDGSEGAQWN